MELILDLIYIYIAVFSIYFFALGVRSLNCKKLKSDVRHAINVDPKPICVVLYSHNDFDALKSMLNQLNHQNYSAENVIIYVILDNCSDHSEELLPNSSNMRVMNLNDGVTVGKDQAISILMESLRQDSYIDSYVFIDNDRFIEEDFLEIVNRALSIYPVLTGETVVIENDNMSKKEKIKVNYTKYINGFVRKSRAMFGLSDIVDRSLFCIKKDFFEKTDLLDLKDINTELSTSLELSRIGYPCKYCPEIKSYIKLSSFNIERPSISHRLRLFKQNFSGVFTKNVIFSEHVFSLIAPSALVSIMITAFYLALSSKYYFLFNFLTVFTIFSILLLGFAISILTSGIIAKDFVYLSLYPIYSIGHLTKNLPPIRFVKRHFFSKKKKDIQKYTVKVIATNGKSNIPCKLDLISENDLARVVFTFKKKKFKSSKQIRMVEALGELITKLNDYGFSLKICYCCEYFSSIVDGSKNMVQGECSFQFKGRNPNDTLTTLLWNSCSACKAKRSISVIEDIRLNH